MFCKFCGEKIEDNDRFCPKCGAKLNIEEGTENIFYQVIDIDDNSFNKEEKTVKKISDKLLNIIQKVIFGCIITGIIGVTIFLGIVLVELIVCGRVFLFDGYDFIKVLSIISIVLMLIGVCGIITKFILCFIFKIVAFPTTIIKRILLIFLTVACLGCSIWGFVDCGNNNTDYSNGDSSSYWNFYTIYSECSCSYPWADVGTDYLSIDTNPYDYDSDSPGSTTYASKALSAIRTINSKLGLPSYIYNEMLETRALDGRQSYSGTKVNVSWRYHPDSGLEVRYTKK